MDVGIRRSTLLLFANMAMDLLAMLLVSRDMFESANRERVTVVLNNNHAQVRPQPAAPPGTSAVLSQRPWTPAASARRRRLRAPGCG